MTQGLAENQNDLTTSGCAASWVSVTVFKSCSWLQTCIHYNAMARKKRLQNAVSDDLQEKWSILLTTTQLLS